MVPPGSSSVSSDPGRRSRYASGVITTCSWRAPKRRAVSAACVISFVPSPPPLKPTVNVRSSGVCLAATAVTAAESTPPLSITPSGRSLMSWRTTARSNASPYSSISSAASRRLALGSLDQ